MSILQELLNLNEAAGSAKLQGLANKAGEMMWHNWMNGGSSQLTQYQTSAILAEALAVISGKSADAAHSEFEKLAEAAMKAKGNK